MTVLVTDAFRPVGPGSAIPNDSVVPYYLLDRKLRISVARVDDRRYAFDDLCTCGAEACPLSWSLLAGRTIMGQCHGSRLISPLERSLTARRPSHSTSTKCKRSKAAFMSEPNCDDRQLAVEIGVLRGVGLGG